MFNIQKYFFIFGIFLLNAFFQAQLAFAEWKSLGTVASFTGNVNIKQCRYRVSMDKVFFRNGVVQDPISGEEGRLYYEFPLYREDKIAEKDNRNQDITLHDIAFTTSSNSTWGSSLGSYGTYPIANHPLLRHSSPEDLEAYRHADSRSYSSNLNLRISRVLAPQGVIVDGYSGGNSIYMNFNMERNSLDSEATSLFYLNPEKVFLEEECACGQSCPVVATATTPTPIPTFLATVSPTPSISKLAVTSPSRSN